MQREHNRSPPFSKALAHFTANTKPHKATPTKLLFHKPSFLFPQSRRQTKHKQPLPSTKTQEQAKQPPQSKARRQTTSHKPKHKPTALPSQHKATPSAPSSSQPQGSLGDKEARSQKVRDDQDRQWMTTAILDRPSSRTNPTLPFSKPTKLTR